MGIILIAVGVVLFIVLLFIIIERPFYPAAILIFMMIYIVNLKIPGPLDARGLLLLLLFARLVLFDKENFALVSTILFRNPFFYLALTFLIFSFIVTYSNDGTLKVALKSQVVSLVALMLGFIIISNKKGRNAFIIGLIAAGLLSVFDLVLHYTIGSAMSKMLTIKEELTILRLLDLFTLSPQESQWGTNHNFPGYLSGMAFLFVYLNHYRKNWKKTFTIPLLILLGMGVFLSTSRSTIISLILIMFFISFSQGQLSFNLKKIITTVLAIIFVYISFYFIYDLFLKNSSADSGLVHVAYRRLYEEPFETFGRGTKKYDIYTGDSPETSASFRFEKATHDVNKFLAKDLMIQLFGYGTGGYKYIGQRIFQDYDKSYVLAPHNGYVLILIENGIIGLLIFSIISVGLSARSVTIIKRTHLDFPMFYLFLMLMIFVIGQNGELTNSLSFLMIGGMIANVTVFDSEQGEEEDMKLNESKHLNLIRNNS